MPGPSFFSRRCPTGYIAAFSNHAEWRVPGQIGNAHPIIGTFVFLAMTVRSRFVHFLTRGGELRQLLTIPKSLIAEMIAHALDTDPEECCGLLLGRDDSVSTSRRVSNTHENRVSRYTMDPLEVMKIEKEADQLGLDLTAIYHSHTFTQGYPSDTDVRNATESGWADRYYVLVSLVEKTRPVVRAFWITAAGEVTEIFIQTA